MARAMSATGSGHFGARIAFDRDGFLFMSVGDRMAGLGGPTGVTTVTLSLEIYAETYQAVRELADLCRLALDGYGATVDNVIVSNVSLDNESDGFVQLQGGESAPFLSVSQTYSILWQEI